MHLDRSSPLPVNAPVGQAEIHLPQPLPGRL